MTYDPTAGDILEESSDNFGRVIANPLVDLVDVAGEKDFTPERLRYFKDGTRVFLQYGTDATFSETNQGYRLQPGSDQTLTLRTAEKASYQVGFDLWPTVSHSINQAPASGDVVGGGYGTIDLANFDPATITYSGTDADGYFWYQTNDTGLDQVVLAMVQSGTVLDSRTVDRDVAADIFTIMEQRLNWYAVGPSVYRQISTNISSNPDDPQVNTTLGAVANDDGTGPAEGSHRFSMAIHQAAGNSGLELTVGSIAIRAPGTAQPQFKVKGHSMDLDNTNTTLGTYQALAAIRIDPDRENVKLRFNDLKIIKTPGSSVNRTRVLIMATDPANTNADTFTFSPPVEHSEANSVLREVEVAGDAGTPMTGPIEDDAGTDSTGATTANTTDNPGGYQIGRTSLTPQGGGVSTSISESRGVGNRELYPGDIAILWVDSDTSGIHEIDVLTEQNS